MSSVEVIKNLVSHESAGPEPSFTLTHVTRALLIVGASPRIGRKKLSELLGIGEGSVRTMLQRLQECGILTTSKEGCKLTDSGLALYKWFTDRLAGPLEIELGDVWGYPHTACIIVRGAAPAVWRGIEQRDAAIREGANGAMTLVFKQGELHMPMVSNVSQEHPDFASKILERLSLSDGDVIILAGAQTKNNAEYGALAAALTTLGLLRL